jgi:hypothetical protein
VSDDETKDVFEALADANYLPPSGTAANEALRTLARLNVASGQVAGRVGTTYLRILVASAKYINERGVPDLTAAVGNVHSAYYAEVLIGVTTPDLKAHKGDSKEERKRKALERNSRSNFARTAASTFLAWIKAGGDVTKLDPATITKSQLAVETKLAKACGVSPAAAASAPALIDHEAKAVAASKRLISALEALAKESPAMASTIATDTVGDLRRF